MSLESIEFVSKRDKTNLNETKHSYTWINRLSGTVNRQSLKVDGWTNDEIESHVQNIMSEVWEDSSDDTMDESST